WLDSGRDTSGLVTSGGVPPVDETRYSPPFPSGEKRIVPSRFQVPPRPLGASHSTCADFAETSTFLSFPLAKNPMNRPSGDQKGWDAPSVPGTPVCARLPTWCVQITYLFD